MKESFKHILAIARAERLLIFRTAKFLVLSGIGLLIVALFIFGTTMATIFGNNPPGEFLLQGTDALLAMYLFSFLQAILIVFIASDFRKTEARARLDEVMYSRPVNTASWVVGKYWGVVSSVIYLNIALILLASIGRVFKWYFVDASIGLQPAFEYIFIATIPSILFMTSLVFFLVSLLRIQALAIIVPIGYVASIFFYFHNNYLGFFDYGCFFAPLFASDLIGFADLEYLISQRIFYTLFAFALLAFSIVLFPRPRQNQWLHRIIFGAGIVLSIAAFAVVVNVVQIENKKNIWADEARAYQKNKNDDLLCQVTNYNFNLEIFQNQYPLKAQIELTVKNPNEAALDVLNFSLNQGFRVQSVRAANGNERTFQHDKNVLSVDLPVPLQSGDSLKINVTYAGKPDERSFMLDRLPEQDDLISKREGPFLKSSISAWIDKNYVFLPMEIGWYPVPGVSFGFSHSASRPLNFATARFNILGPGNLQYITQGKPLNNDGSGKEFIVEKPVPGFSLNAGPYEKLSRSFRQMDIELYFYAPHLPDIKEFEEIADTCFEAIETMFDEIETITGLPYPYPRLAFVESPTQMQIYLTESGVQNTLLQPGIIMIDETEITGRNIKKEIENRTKRAKRRGQDDSPQKIKRDVFIDFMLDYLIPSNFWRGDGTLNSPLKNHLHFQMDIRNPVLARALEVQYFELCEKRIYDTFFPKSSKRRFSSFDELRNFNSGWAIRRRYDVNLDSLIQILEQVPLSQLKPQGKGGLYRAAVDFKSPQILEMLRNLVGEEQWQKGIQELVKQYRYKPVTRENLLEMVQNGPASVESDFFETWFDKKTYPGYKIISAEAQKLKPRGSKNIKMGYQIKVKVRNGEEGAGFVRLLCRLKGDDTWKKVYLNSFEEKEILFPVYAQPKEIELYPYYARNRGKIKKAIRIKEGLLRKQPVDTSFVIKHSLSDSLNFVLDDQSEKFSAPVQNESKYFRPALKGKSWQARIDDVAFGDYYLSWHFKRGGSGEYPARWEAEIPKTGSYSLSYRLPYGKTWFLHPRHFVDELILKIYAADGEQKIKLRPAQTSDDWLPMGQFYFEKGKPAIVEIIDEGNGRLIADAIRWEFVN
ncbi:MAG: hypothetical protein DWQ05_03710 [Calditrichaeota bacterium]|nr:MAG: hypothetical protein DWQ05_03710 [Calditrichota bacterium]